VATGIDSPRPGKENMWSKGEPQRGREGGRGPKAEADTAILPGKAGTAVFHFFFAMAGTIPAGTAFLAVFTS
jgi:hypothetical protein